MARTNRIAVEVHKGCGGWVGIAPTLDVEPMTDNGDTVTIRVMPQLDLEEYQEVGRCACSGVRVAPDDEWIRWMDQSFANGVEVAS